MPTAARVLDAALEATIVGSFTRIGPALRSRAEDWTPLDAYDLTGRTVLVTGANSGLGLATATQLAAMNARVRVTVRSQAKGVATVEAIRAATGNDDVAHDLLDLTDLTAVRAFAQRFAAANPTLDAVVHNAGAMFQERAEVDGIERTALVHVVAPTLLTHGLLTPLRASQHPGRVVFVTSGGMYATAVSARTLQSPDDYRPATAYARAKRAQVLLTEHLAARLAPEIAVNVMHPGWAATPGVEDSLPVFNRVLGPLLRTPEGGSDTAAWLVADDAGGRQPSGQLWLDRRPRSTVRAPGTATPPRRAEALVAEVLRLAGLPTDAFTPVPA